MVENGYLSFLGRLQFPDQDSLQAWLAGSLEDYDIEDLGGIFFDIHEAAGRPIQGALDALSSFGSWLASDGALHLIAAPEEDATGRAALGLAAAAIASVRHGAEGELYFLGSAGDDFALRIAGGSYTLDGLELGDEAYDAAAGSETMRAVRAALGLSVEDVVRYGFFITDDEDEG